MVRRSSLALLLSLIPFCLAAQESPFHGGQWAMQFGGSANFYSLGVLRFTGPRGAWILDLSNSATVIDAKSTDNVGTTTNADQQSLSLTTRLGRRFYQPRQSKIVSFQTVAFEFGWSDDLINYPTDHFRQTSWSTGLGLELGAAYMLAPGVSLGGTAGLSTGYLSFRSHTSASNETGHGFYTAMRVFIALGIYF